jgi:hypothetical protein
MSALLNKAVSTAINSFDYTVVARESKLHSKKNSKDRSGFTESSSTTPRKVEEKNKVICLPNLRLESEQEPEPARSPINDSPEYAVSSKKKQDSTSGYSDYYGI